MICLPINGACIVRLDIGFSRSNGWLDLGLGLGSVERMVGFGSDCGVCQNRHRAAAGTAACDKAAAAGGHLLCAHAAASKSQGFCEDGEKSTGEKKIGAGLLSRGICEKIRSGLLSRRGGGGCVS